MNRAEQSRVRGHQRADFVKPLEEMRRHIAAGSSIIAIHALLIAEADGLPHSLCMIILEFSNNPSSVHLGHSCFASKMVWVSFFFSFAILFSFIRKVKGNSITA